MSKDNSEPIKIETFPIGSFACNCTLIYSTKTNECIIIDPGNDATTLFDIIQRKKLKVKALLHTHAHFDHIGSSQYLKKTFKAPIYLHQYDEFLYDSLLEQGLIFGIQLEAPGQVDSYLEDGLTIGLSDPDFNDPGLEVFLQVLHTPGHTPGSCCFYSDHFDRPLLFSGDTMFRHSIGRTDLPGGDSDLIINSIKNRLYTLPDETYVIPGHGPSTGIYDEKRQNPFV